MTVIDADWIIAWCPECAEWVSPTLSYDEMHCPECTFPVIRLIDPRRKNLPKSLAKWREMKDLEGPL